LLDADTRLSALNLPKQRNDEDPKAKAEDDKCRARNCPKQELTLRRRVLAKILAKRRFVLTRNKSQGNRQHHCEASDQHRLNGPASDPPI
jgi:hypothetical protein